VGNSGHRPLKGSTVSFNSVTIERQTRGRTNGEEQGAVTEIGLIAVVFSDKASAAIGKEALDECPGLHSGIAVQGKLIGGVIKYVAAKRKSPAGKAGSVDAQLITCG